MMEGIGLACMICGLPSRIERQMEDNRKRGLSCMNLFTE